ncbi:ankyrin repeat domain-containing protein [Comamonas sp. AG1104]|uniref:ankyrin repeat domain-containing protein n=1 Tax=Comamonas sp. AG1104 TaxID=2183900 RepID=UPI000E0B1787|nr:ankyrin repeat domain-containing protein [Comamonas sp. AG1104]RDI11736.1 hypothetical protein DFO48_104430 [Comamonas sp. AG1104]
MYKKTLLAALVGTGLGMNALAADIRDQWDIQISKAELVFPGTPPQDAANGIKDALSQFAIPANLSYRAMPSTPPARPGAPRLKQMSGAVPSPEYLCEDAYAEIYKKPPPVKNAFAFIAEGHQVCLYSFAQGVKAYVVYYSIKRTESLTSGLFNGITKAIRGSDEDRAAGQLKENIDAIRTKLPKLLVERIDIPGRPQETPDLQAVTALIPPAPEATATVTVAASQTAAAVGTPLQTKVEARKNLTAMGMTYHSQPQFMDAIRRKDDVAVQLFIDGGGINLDAIDGSGKTALQIAQAQGTPEIVALLQPRTKPAAVEVPASVGATPALLQPASADAAPVDFSKIPPELLSEMDAEVAKLPVSAEQKQLARNNLARQYLKIQALANALKSQ